MLLPGYVPKLRKWDLDNTLHPMTWQKGYAYACKDKFDVEFKRTSTVRQKIYSDDSSAIIAEGREESLRERIEKNYGRNYESLSYGSLQTIQEVEAEEDDGNAEEVGDMNYEVINEALEEQKNRIKKALSSTMSAVRRTGDFSITTKIARNGSKSTVTMINVNPELVDMIPASFKAHEHSFAKAKPQESNIEVNYSIKKPSKTATKGERDRFINTLLEVRKLLGVSYTANGDTSATGERIIKNAKLKINKTMLPKGGGLGCTKTITNTYIIGVVEWAILLSKMELEKLNALDKALISRIRS